MDSAFCWNIGEYGLIKNLEHVLSSMNQLNRSLENVISVGQEFESVGDLWTNFSSAVQRDVVKQQKEEEKED